MSQEPRSGGRRHYDPETEIDADIQLFVRNEVAETRHLLKNELAGLGTVVANAQMQSTKEHAEVHGVIQELRGDVRRLREDVTAALAVRDRVTTLEGHDQSQHAVAAAMDRMNRRFYALAGLIVAASGVLVAVLK